MDFPGGLVVKNPPANAGAQVQSLVQEVSTCHGATKPVHNYWACARATSLPQREACALQLERARAQQWRPSAAKTN